MVPRVLRILGLGVVLACAEPFAPAHATPYMPPVSYQEWWAQMEACSSIVAPFDRVAWYVVPGDRFTCPVYEAGCWGLWHGPHTIYMASLHEDVAGHVEHEMLHDLLQRGDHPAVFDTCGVR